LEEKEEEKMYISASRGVESAEEDKFKSYQYG
jgi:hypothetical protein